jgi:hypothetical protein
MGSLSFLETNMLKSANHDTPFKIAQKKRLPLR